MSEPSDYWGGPGSYRDIIMMPKWFEKGKEPKWFIQAIIQWDNSTVTMPD